ncbi:N-acetylmuramoyl-L-alanine amidase-like domain-containing protein [Erysipelothrix aquatica]|uniref:N-acetylmuramoyl-L-alanine amidase-like domain-containing protein n=1 Tax=Erysipelothrix aquatica TaxID=2683714 RepID=UPI001915DB86|nr:N-acetylmuramoyl-L-alanine amidase-like domain-containing protein [Erysipelothrix aquatica]
MKKFLLAVLTLALCVSPFTMPVYADDAIEPTIQFDETSQKMMRDVFTLLKDNKDKTDAEKIEIVSGYFLDTPYVANRLVGSNTQPEELVIALNELDCFTFLDYIETFKRSKNEEDFVNQLKTVRYINGNVEYLSRKHFYSDWYSENQILATDLLTQPEFSEFVQTDTVELNQGAKGVYIPGLNVRERDINYVPRDKVSNVLPLLKTGDYIGIRKNIAGLDVTHTGIVIEKQDGVYMRHASSSKSALKVVDQKITDYLDINTSVAGLLFFRSNAQFEQIHGTVNIEFKDEAGNTIKETLTESLPYGEPFNIAAPNLPGYEFVRATDNTGIVQDTNTVTFTYRYTSEAFDIQFDDTSKRMMDDVFTLLRQNNLKTDAEKLEIISAYFLETPYVANRLVGSTTDPEQLVIALNELDCFTFLDYIESFKQSHSVEDFINNLKNVRYRDAKVDYLHRKHFYSDWYTESPIVATDLLTSPQYASIVKTDSVDLNQGANGVYIPGLAVRNRDINYIPRDNVTEDVLKTFKTGDYIGIRKNIAGLDVTHTGIVIQKEDGTYMRHASSSKSSRKVVDQKLTDYLEINTSVSGLLFFRSNSEFKPFMSTVTIEYKDELGNVLLDAQDVNLKLMESYKLEAPTIEGYALVNDSTAEGIANTDVLSINFIYKKIDDIDPIEKDKNTGTLPATGVNGTHVYFGGALLISFGIATLLVSKMKKNSKKEY